MFLDVRFYGAFQLRNHKNMCQHPLPELPLRQKYDSLVMMTYCKHCYFRCSRPPDVDGITILDKDDQAAKLCSFMLMFCSLVIFFKKFDHINIRRPWVPEITMFCIKTRRHWLPIWFYIFFSKACFSSWLLPFTPGGFLIKL